MSEFLKCPAGHGLPNHTPAGQCTPVYCAAGGETPVKKKGKRGRPKKARPISRDERASELAASTPSPIVSEEIAAAAQRMQDRHEFLKTPKGLAGAQAEQWADEELVNMLPIAVSELKYQLLMGDDRARADAVKQVLDANGRGKKEALAGGASPIIVINGQSVKSLPWSSKVVDNDE